MKPAADGENSGELNKENKTTPPATTAAPPAPSKPFKSIHAQVQRPAKKAQKQAVLPRTPKKPKADRNALSARSGTLLSNSAIKAQTRADAKEKEQRNEGTVSKHVADAVATWVAKAAAGAKRARPSAPCSNLSLDRKFKTKVEARSFLQAMVAEHDIFMFNEDGDIVGRGPSPTNERYGGEGDPPLPPHAAEAFLVLNDGPDAVYGGWSVVGKRGKIQASSTVTAGDGEAMSDWDSDDADLYERMEHPTSMSAAQR